MGWLGNSIRKIDGENYAKEGEFESESDSKHWAEYYRTYGFKVRIIPNAQHQKFEIWVSEHPSASAPAAMPPKV